MPKRKLIILGIDPGLSNTGYGVIARNGQEHQVLDQGVIVTSQHVDFAQRLGQIVRACEQLILKHRPDVMALEELFFHKNVKTALSVGQAKGAVIAEAQRAGLEVYQYTPLQVKLAIAGYGKADKAQVQKMVKLILRLKELPRPSHAADALAVALCCAHTIA